MLLVVKINHTRIGDEKDFEDKIVQNRNYIVHGKRKGNFVPANYSELKNYNSKLKQLIRSYLLHKIGFTYEQIKFFSLITDEQKEDNFITRMINKNRRS